MDISNPRKPTPDRGGESLPNESRDSRLALAWRRQRQWSLLADAVKKRLDRWRLSNLLLLVFGALMGALAAQAWLTPGAAQGCAIVAAMTLALAGFIQVNALSGDRMARWSMARAAAEALKAECYRYLIRVQPYAGQDRDQVLESQLDVVQNRARDLLVDQQTTTADDRPLPAVNSIVDYLEDRAARQATWHRAKSAEKARKARTLRNLQLTSTAIGVVLSAITVFVPSWGLSTWIAAATTIAGAFGAHLAAMQHQRIAAGYASTADQLERLISSVDITSATATQQAEFVADVERVLAAQNNGWTDLLGSGPHNETKQY